MKPSSATPPEAEAGQHPPSAPDLNLLLEWPNERTGAQWVAILAASVALHVLLFLGGSTIPSLVGQRAPDREVIARHVVPLYLPPDVLTQKAPNRQKVAKQIDLADLAPSAASRPSPDVRRPSVRRFELPKQTVQTPAAKNQPQILPQAPTLAVNQSPMPAAGAPGGLPIAPPPPSQASAGPFQNIGSAEPLNPHPKLVPPKATVDAVVSGLAQSTNGRDLVITDDLPEQRLPAPGNPGTLAQAPAQHAAVELQSDPSGADFHEYLRQILTIVRGNWRRVIPESARLGMLRGRTVVEFIISRDGTIPKMVTADPSGSEPLDRAAVAGLSMSNPLPPLPADFKGFQVRLAFTFAYNQSAR